MLESSLVQQELLADLKRAIVGGDFVQQQTNSIMKNPTIEKDSTTGNKL